MDRIVDQLPPPPEAMEGLPMVTDAIFADENASSGKLSVAVSHTGWQTAQPDEYSTGGTNLLNPGEVEKLWHHWVALSKRGLLLILHWAPPCSSLSKARQRSFLTRVRSAAFPWGLRRLTRKQKAAVRNRNKIALAADSLAWGAHTLLGADITVENPDASFIWQLGLFDWGSHKDFRFSPCMLGDDIAKPTRIMAW